MDSVTGRMRLCPFSMNRVGMCLMGLREAARDSVRIAVEIRKGLFNTSQLWCSPFEPTRHLVAK
jgi:hypothetical protein